MEVLILPVSGGGFPVQIGEVEMLTEAQYKPDIILAASGGNIPAYTALAGNFKPHAIRRITSSMSSNLFLKTLPLLTSFSSGYVDGSLYDHSYGMKDLLNIYFSTESIQRIPIWTSAYNRTQRKTTLFCNTNAENIKLNTTHIDYDLVQCTKPVFTDGNIDTIALAVTASCSIPTLVPAVSINGDYYVDGGMHYSSPFIPLRSCLPSNNIHLTYVNSVDVNNINQIETTNILDHGKQAICEIVTGQIINDRLACHNKLFSSPDSASSISYSRQNPTFESGALTVDIVNRILLDRKSHHTTLLEIYPYNDGSNLSLTLNSFTPDDVVDLMDSSKLLAHYRYWKL